MIEYLHVSRDGWLLYLAAGWRLPWVVQPSMGNHGQYAVTLWRPAVTAVQEALL